MIKYFKISLLIIVAVTVINSCKKYTEGPLISFRTKTHRISQNWKCVSYLVNGNDGFTPTNQNYNYYSTACSKNFTWTYYYQSPSAITVTIMREGSYDMTIFEKVNSIDYSSTDATCQLAMKGLTEFNSTESGSWKFSSDKKKVILTDNGGDIITYDILELREKEMKWKGTNNGNVQEFTFQKP